MSLCSLPTLGILLQFLFLYASIYLHISDKWSISFVHKTSSYISSTHEAGDGNNNVPEIRAEQQITEEV